MMIQVLSNILLPMTRSLQLQQQTRTMIRGMIALATALTMEIGSSWLLQALASSQRAMMTFTPIKLVHQWLLPTLQVWLL